MDWKIPTDWKPRGPQPVQSVTKTGKPHPGYLHGPPSWVGGSSSSSKPKPKPKKAAPKRKATKGKKKTTARCQCKKGKDGRYHCFKLVRSKKRKIRACKVPAKYKKR